MDRVDRIRRLLVCALLAIATSGRALALPGPVTLGVYRGQISAARQLVSACRTDAGACRADSLPSDESVLARSVSGGASDNGFHAGWQWLQDAFNRAAKAPAADRVRTMDAADNHLAALTSELERTAANPTRNPFPSAHAAAARVLASEEFQTDGGPSWLDRQIARLQDALFELFAGMGRLGSRNPWIAPLIEWFCFGLAAAGLLLFAYRSLRRQSLRLSLVAETAAVQSQPLINWAARVEAAERAGDFRKALHDLYWGAIASLEARRTWRPNPTRTPREYIELLRQDDGTQSALRALTRRFERSWYGFGVPAAAEVEAAKRESATVLQTVAGRAAPADSRSSSSPQAGGAAA